MTFVIKRGDTLPNIPFVLYQPDGLTPLNLSTAASVYIVVKSVGTVQVPGTLLLKKACTITDAVNGAGIYDWVAADTLVEGTFQYEFEITWNNGDIQTVPAGSYLDLLINSDLG